LITSTGGIIIIDILIIGPHTFILLLRQSGLEAARARAAMLHVLMSILTVAMTRQKSLGVLLILKSK